jgi:quinohemoprotein ethanol dehydrogenase
MTRLTTLLLLCAALTSCTEITPSSPKVVKGSVEHIQQVTTAINDHALANANATPGDWLSYGRNYQEDRYSPLTQINKENLNQLGLAWTLELGTKRGIQATPLVVDGIMFFSGPWSLVYAVDSRHGKILWRYDPKVPRDIAPKLCCGVVNRGLALYEGDLFVGTLDGRLVSIKAHDGSLNWQTKTVPENSYLTITGAPRVVKGRVLIGNGGSEYTARGYITAYDAKTGEQAWRFYTVPGNPGQPFEHPDLEEAAKTWTGEWWTHGGGGTVWDSFVYDAELNLVYIGVGNGSPWDRKIRSPDGGDNLYLSSIVALNADTGVYQWHYQTTPGDSWDYTATQPIILADIEIEDKMRQVLMQAPKNGFFYIIDRVTGEFISAKPFTYVNWASSIDSNGRPVENPGARYEDGKAHWISPGSHGGHNWFPMSYNPKTGLVYIPTAIRSTPYLHSKNDEDTAGIYLGVTVSQPAKLYFDNVFDSNPQAPKPGAVAGQLIAYDPIKQERVWAIDQPLHYNGGLLSTATGLLLQGDAEGKFSIRNIDDGAVLKQFDLRSGIIAAPVTYLVDGEQYISILAGWGGGQGLTYKSVEQLHPGTLYTFKLGGAATAPESQPVIEKPFTTLASEGTADQIGHGFNVFAHACAGCHKLGEGGGAAPDLTRSSDAMFSIYQQILLDGGLASQGMPDFAEVLSKDDVEAVRGFVLYSAKVLRGGMSYQVYLGNLRKMQEGYDASAPKN